MKSNKWILSYIVCFGLSAFTHGFWQTETRAQDIAGVKEVKLTLVSQKWLPDSPLVRQGDVIEVVKDDLIVRFRLYNCSKENIHYLSTIYEKDPTGYILYRQPGEKNWSATSPARGREGSLTGGGYEWRLLAPGKYVEFEFSDLSTRGGEHAISVLVNIQPTHEGRRELISDSYHPIKRNQTCKLVVAG